MSYVWIWQQGSENEGRWAAVELHLDGQALALTGHADRPVELVNGSRPAEAGAFVLGRRDADGGEHWTLFARPGGRVYLNGQGLPAGMKALHHKDEIRVGEGESGRMYFSAERPARVEPFPGMGRPVRCARCYDPVEVGQPAVQCPKCRLWYHQSPSEDPAEDRPCWTYDPACSHCSWPTDLAEAQMWTPEDIGVYV